MAQLYSMTSLRDSSSPPKTPSNCGSGLGGLFTSPVSLSGLTTLKEMPATAGDPGPEPQPKKNVVVVIGAGISGLRAAAVLLRHGIDVVVVEARNRIGGRIHTTRTANGARDIGAAWMHETSQNKLVKLIRKLGIDYYYDDGAALYYTEQGRAGAQFKAKKVADEFADYAEWFYKSYPDAPDRDVSSFVNEFVSNHELITKDEQDWAPQAVKEVELWIGTSVEQASSKHLSYFITERNLYMKGGYDSIVNWTAQSIVQRPDVLHLNHVVETVNWSNDPAVPSTVECRRNDGTLCTFEADAVVCTLPLGVLRHNLVSFSPSLPHDIYKGISRFSYGALGKVFFEFADVFWSKDNDQFIFYPTPPGVIDDDVYGSSAGSSSSTGQDSILNYATVTINLWIMKGSKELCVQIAEPLTQRIEAMTDKKAIYKFFEPLFKLLRTEPYKALPRLINVETTHWTQDPYAGFGSYSAEKVGDDSDILIDALEDNKSSRLQFAGEHCTLAANGCVHGAFYTGEVAANNIIRSLGIPLDDGDLGTQHDPLDRGFFQNTVVESLLWKKTSSNGSWVRSISTPYTLLRAKARFVVRHA